MTEGKTRPTLFDIFKIVTVGLFFFCLSLLLLIIFPFFIISFFFLGARVFSTAVKYLRARMTGAIPSLFAEKELS